MPTAAAIAIFAAANLLHRVFLLPYVTMTFDSWGHLYFAAEAKRSRCGPFGPLHPRVAGGEAFYYPLLIHWLYGFLPRSVLRDRSALINPVLETLFLAAALTIAAASGVGREVVLVAGATYMLTPLWFSKLAFGPRVLAFTPRLASEVAYSLALMVALLDFGLPTPAAVVIAA